MQMISYLGGTSASGAALPQVVSTAFPLPVTLSGGLGGLAVAGTVAAGAAVGAQFPVTVGGVDGGGLARQFLTDATGVLQVNASIAGGTITVAQGAGNTANPWTVQGPVAGGVATSGNPLKVGGVFNTALPTYLTGQTGELQLTNHGQIGTVLYSSTGGLIGSGSATDAQGGQTGIFVIGQNEIFNGASWDRQNKPRTAFRLPSSALSNNAANIKTTPGTVFSISGNVTLAASTCYVKLFDTTGVPNPAALNPLYIFAANILDAVFSFNLPAGGLYFPTGIGIAIVANPADLDNTAIAAGQVTALLVTFQ